MSNNVIRNICICLLVISLLLLGIKNFDNLALFNKDSKSENSPSSRMSYGRFLDYLDNDPEDMIDTLNYWVGTDC